MRKIIMAIAALAVIAGSPLKAARVDPNNPPEALARIRKGVNENGATQCDFTESRKFPFRKNASILKGTCTFIPARGLVLEYKEPRHRTIAMNDDRLVTIENGQRSVRELPGQYAGILHVYNLDPASLGDEWHADFTGDDSEWTLTISSEHKPLAQGKPVGSARIERMEITMSGKERLIRHISIRRPGAIEIEIDMGTPSSPDKDELSTIERLLTE